MELYCHRGWMLTLKCVSDILMAEKSFTALSWIPKMILFTTEHIGQKIYTGLILGRQQAMVAKTIILLIETIVAISCLFLQDSKVLNSLTILY